MTKRTAIGGLHVANQLLQLINNEMLAGTGIEKEYFWTAFEKLIADFAPRNKALLQVREDLQAKIDDYHKERKGKSHNANEYKAFLQEINYLLPEGDDFKISVTNVDEEIALVPGPQLVVPVKNARFALNAANARWGSLYDALYGTDVISEDDGAERVGAYNPIRGNKVIAFARKHLDLIAPLESGSHLDSVQYSVENNALSIQLQKR